MSKWKFLFNLKNLTIVWELFYVLCCFTKPICFQLLLFVQVVFVVTLHYTVTELIRYKYIKFFLFFFLNENVIIKKRHNRTYLVSLGQWTFFVVTIIVRFLPGFSERRKICVWAQHKHNIIFCCNQFMQTIESLFLMLVFSEFTR